MTIVFEILEMLRERRKQYLDLQFWKFLNFEIINIIYII